MSELEINHDDIARFFKVLAPSDKELFSGWFCHESGDRPVSGFIYGPVFNIIEQATRMYRDEKATLHICLNRTSDKGRKLGDIQSVRVLCLDLDTVSTIDTIRKLKEKYKPHLIVESSPGKYHVYWRIDSTTPLDLWKEMQLGLAVKFGGDKHLNQPNKTIRVPGIPRKTKDGGEYVPRVVYLAETLGTLDWKAIGYLMPDIWEAARRGEVEEKERRVSVKKLAGGKELAPEELAKLSESRNQTIHDTVRRAVMSAKGSAPGKPEEWFSEENAITYAFEIAAKLEAENTDKPPLEDAEIEKAAKSAYRLANEIIENEAIKNEKKVSNLNKIQLSESKLVFDYDYSTGALKENRFSEVAVTERAIQRFGNRLLRANRRVYAFSDSKKIWQVQPSEDQSLLYGFANKALTDTQKDPEFINMLCVDEHGKYSKKAHERAKDRLSKLGLVERVVRSVAHSPDIKELKFDDFDAHPYLFFAQNGVLDLLTGEIRDPEPEDYLLNRSNVAWDPNADYSEWEEFLYQVFSENNEPERMVNFMQELFGYSLSGLISAQKLFCHFGDGSNGKSKVMRALALVSGDYSARLASDDIVTKRNAQAKAMERIGAKIEGHRVVIIDDIAVDTVWAEGFVKSLTDELVTARGEYEKWRVVANRASLHLGLNVAPTPEGENHGILRRICLIPYVKRFAHNSKVSDKIDAMIKRQLPGILRFAAEGLRRFVERGGFDYPAELDVAVEEYKDEHFKQECVIKHLLRRPEPKEDCELAFASDLNQEINEYLESDRQHGKGMSPEQLGRAIKRNFPGVKAEMAWCARRKNSYRAYRLVRLYSPKSLTRESKYLSDKDFSSATSLV